MIKIMLACCAGMSTSVLVSKMKEHCQKNNIEAEIWAISEQDVKKEIEKCDVLLLGPQVRHLLPEIKVTADSKNVPVAVIDMMAYGTCNGKKVVSQAQELVQSK
ncbi:PTS sugar transporter subunit IIB [Clostridium chromiireducens]|uniref:PTS sugar transporter subunit IIB n=1 Tax=Clostridium chromiireducens TaxID=225345 RepID=UPI003AF7B5ED